MVSVVRHVLHYGFASRLSVHAGNSVFLLTLIGDGESTVNTTTVR